MKVHGQSHAAVISNVNNRKTGWGHIFYHYQGLSETVSKGNFSSVARRNTRGEDTEWFRLASVDAAILSAVGGVVNAKRLRDEEMRKLAASGRKRRRAPADG